MQTECMSEITGGKTRGARRSELKDMTLPALKARVELLGIELQEVDPLTGKVTVLAKSKQEIIAYLRFLCGEEAEPRNDLPPSAATTEEGGVLDGEGEAFSAEQVVLEDFTALRESLRDQARTTVKLFQANNPC
ncbi:hypothetical protein B484DRAFT_408428 [Ochromonadaceae sp. CCMP2298]|nr:hypothetical protein B484DRAFT_408428 [Ochromonadaceae sp. CCMP2298]